MVLQASCCTPHTLHITLVYKHVLLHVVHLHRWANLVQPGEKMLNATEDAMSYMQQQLPASRRRLLLGRYAVSTDSGVSDTHRLPLLSGLSLLEAIEARQRPPLPSRVQHFAKRSLNADTVAAPSSRFQGVSDWLIAMSELHGAYEACTPSSNGSIRAWNESQAPASGNTTFKAMQEGSAISRQPSAYTAHDLKMGCLVLFVVVAAVTVVQGCVWALWKALHVHRAMPM